MAKKKWEQNIRPTIFEEKEVRRAWHVEKWYFVIADVVQVLTNSRDVQGYIKDMRRRDPELSQGGGQIATPLGIETTGGRQKMNCSSLEGMFRIIQSIRWALRPLVRA